MIAYIIPGFGESGKENQYKKIKKIFTDAGFTPKIVKIDWKYKVMSDYVSQFLEQCKVKNQIIFGFSFGAMVAVITAKKTKPKALILASLSPYFKEDLRFIPKKWYGIIGTKRIERMSDFSFNSLAKECKCKTYVLAGENEGKLLERRALIAKKMIKKSTLTKVPDTKHELNDEYLNIIKNILSNIF